MPMDELADDYIPTPRFLQDKGHYSRCIPLPVQRVCTAGIEWGKGPVPPREYIIQPWYRRVQEAPIRLLDRYMSKKKHRIALFVGFCCSWLVIFSVILHQSTNVSEIADWGLPANIGCLNTYWVPGNTCGINGNNCRPFNGSGLAFRCPANCAGVRVLNPRAVGAQEVNYRPLIIGGPSQHEDRSIYRGDSFICGAAIHAGIVDNAKGGCGVVHLVGQHHGYESSKQHGIKSVGFDSYFPSSFTFGGATSCEAKDARWVLLTVTVTFSVLLSLFTTSAKTFFFTIFIGVFFQVGLASDPPGHDSINGLISNILGKFLPATFCAFVMYKFMGVRKTLTGLTAQIEKTVLWLGGCWIGALNNHTFAWIPLERLDAHDLKQQPGAKVALAGVIIVLVFIVLQQAYSFQQEGRFFRYLKIYAVLLSAVLVAIVLPGLSLRIHHYILALLLLPGTAMQTRPALLYQGILVGLFINGIARWGFDSVLQTQLELRGDAQHNSLLPNITEPAIQLGANLSTIVFSWVKPPYPYDGVSVLVNDVERYRGYTEDGYPSGQRFVWTRGAGKSGVGMGATDGFEGIIEEQHLPEYFRFAYMTGTDVEDYTRAGTWTADGEWVHMKKGPS